MMPRRFFAFKYAFRRLVVGPTIGPQQGRDYQQIVDEYSGADQYLGPCDGAAR